MSQHAYDLVGPAYDVDNHPGTWPTVSYIICSTPRCGSTLLSEGFLASGCMGIPVEYFNTVYHAPLAARWGSIGLNAYLTDLREHRTDQSGTFGIKMHWAQMVNYHELSRRELGQPPADSLNPEEAHRERYRFLEEAFPKPRFIHITRLNRIRQAVSWYVGARTGEWTRLEGQANSGRGPLPYDLDQILRYLLAIDAAEANWREFFRVNGIRPITIIYEEFANAYTESMAALMRTLGLEPVSLPLPRLKKQADETTEPLVQQAIRDLYASSAML